jgi:hypothetical protein
VLVVVTPAQRENTQGSALFLELRSALVVLEAAQGRCIAALTNLGIDAGHKT